MLKSSPSEGVPISLRTWSGPSRGGVNMIKKFILVAAATAVATSFLPTSSFAKKAKEKPCSVGQVCMNKPDKKGWGTVMRCTYDRKMIGDFSPCNVHSGMCPTTICKSKKKKK